MFLLAFKSPSCCLLLTTCPLLRLCSRTFWGCFQNRRYWHWIPNQTQAALPNWNHEGSGVGREIKKQGLGFSIKGHKKDFEHKLVKCLPSLLLFSIVEPSYLCRRRKLSSPSCWTFVRTCRERNDNASQWEMCRCFIPIFFNQKEIIGIECILWLQSLTRNFPVFSKYLNLLGNTIKALGLINIR